MLWPTPPPPPLPHPKTFSKAEVLALRARIEKMTAAERNTFEEKWSNEMRGQEFGHYPALPYHDVVTDMLHLYLNEWNAALTEAFHQHLLLAEDATDKQIKQLAGETRDKVNARLKQAGTNLMLQFGLPKKSHAVNGPKLKVFLRDVDLLRDLVELLRPMYALMEIKKMGSVKFDEKVNLLFKFDLAHTGQAGQSEKAGPGGGGKGARGKAKAQRTLGLSYADRIRSGLKDTAGAATAAGSPQPMTPVAGKGPGVQARPTYLDRVCVMFYALAEHWEFTHPHDHMDTKALFPAARAELGLQAAKLGQDVERAMLSCIGTTKQRTYAHDIVYGAHKLYVLLGKPYLGATEGNEHAHQEMKTYFKTMCSHSDPNRCDCLQFLDLHTLKRTATAENILKAPANKMTERMSGVTQQSKGGQRTVKVSDASIPDMKCRLLGEVTKEGAQSASPIVLDDFPELIARKARGGASSPSALSVGEKRPAKGSPEK